MANRPNARNWSRFGLLFVAATVGAAAVPARAAITRATGPRATVNGPTAAYLTLLFGRAQWVSTDSTCTPTPGAVTLQDIAGALKTRGLTGSATVVLDRLAETTRLCQGVDQQASWADLSNLQANDGWRFVSQGLTETDVTQLSPSQQQADICGSLPAFTNHGMIGSNGLFAYAGNGHNTTTVQTNVTQTCFDFGRQYSSHTAAAPGSNSFSTTGPPWFQQTMSVIGGQCNDAALPCYTVPVKNNRRSDRYTTLVQAFSPTSGHWNAVQMYRLVSGASSAGADTWDCSPANPDDRWTSIPEEYCAHSYFGALDQALAADPGVIVTDPASVATAWGRSVGSPSAPGAPANVTATGGDSQATVSWTAPNDGGGQITSYMVTASPGPASRVVNGTPPVTTATVTGLTNGTAYTFTVTATNNIGTGPTSTPLRPRHADCDQPILMRRPMSAPRELRGTAPRSTGPRRAPMVAARSRAIPSRPRPAASR